jgi:predicted nucleic acid-binding protein
VIAVDTSSWSAYLEGNRGDDVEALERALEHGNVVLPPVVLSELLSSSQLTEEAKKLFIDLPLLDLGSGYWERAGRLRSTILVKGLRARLADTLIAQSCIDHRVPLVTRDDDFRHFSRLGGLRVS